MQTSSRRSFLKGTLATAAVLLSGQKTRGANDTINVAVVGFNGRGKSHIEGFSKLKGVRVAALCDVDTDVLARETKALQDKKISVQTYTDIRKLLENKDIDVISIATPNHWHALISIWACQAGKDVYVEKPVSHNVSEGRRIVEAARKYNRIVQAGCQSRSNIGMREAIQFIHDGGLGKIKLVRGLCYKPRASIGKVTSDQPVPASIDYDLWSGPAPMTPLRRTKLHYDWHWVWPTGSGDLGNQGIHQMDIARWALNTHELSPKVMSIGGRFGYDDDGETPNTQVIFHEYEPAPLFFEVRGLSAKPGDKEMDEYRGAKVGVVVHCEDGYMVLPSYSGGTAFDNNGKKVKQFKGDSDHFANFIAAVRSRKNTDLNAEIEEGHLSSALCHTGNISYRLGQTAQPEAVAEAIQGDKEAQETLGRMKEHLGVHGIKLSEGKGALGPWLKMDPKSERFIGDGSNTDKANALLTREYRKPFVVPETV